MARNMIIGKPACLPFSNLWTKNLEEVIKGWATLMVTTQDNMRSMKPEEDWFKDEDEESHGNSCALDAISNGVDKNIFRLRNTCIVAKEVWETLKTAH